MMTALKKSRMRPRPVRSADVGRPRKNSPDEGMVLSFRVTAKLRDALDAAVAKANTDQPGRTMSRTEAVKIVLYDWLARGAKLPKK